MDKLQNQISDTMLNLAVSDPRGHLIANMLDSISVARENNLGMVAYLCEMAIEEIKQQSGHDH